MDLQQLEYIIAIAREGNITHAAEKLYISQSALNQQLLHLEQELGAKLFERRNRVMVPTLAGRIYLKAARNMLNMKSDVYKVIRDIADERIGEINVAYTPEVGARTFAQVYPIFHKKYPNVRFKIHEGHGKELVKLLLNKTVSLAAIPYCDFSKRDDIEYIDQDTENLVLGIPASHPLAKMAGDRSFATLPTFDLSLLKDEPFVLQTEQTLIRDMIDRSFAYAHITPKILFESSSSFTIVSMVRSQIAPGFFPQSYVDPGEPIAYFTVMPYIKWTRSMAFLKGSYVSAPEKKFIEMMGNHTRRNLAKTTGEPASSE